MRLAQRGVAILTALLVVTLAALIVSGLFWREHVAVRSVENRLALAQGRWIERAAVDWARVILAEDARTTGGVDHLGEPWAVPVMDTRLDETVTAGAKIEEGGRSALLAGRMVDAQARLNLTGLGPQGQPGTAERAAALRRLIVLLGFREDAAERIILRVQQATPRFQGGRKIEDERPPLVNPADLFDIPGLDPALVGALLPHVVVLPEATKVNLNTAGPEVIAAVIEDAGLSGAGTLIRAREQEAFKSLENVKKQLSEAVLVDQQTVDVQSSYFLVTGVIRFQGMESQTETLLKRSGERVEVVWQRRF